MKEKKEEAEEKRARGGKGRLRVKGGDKDTERRMKETEGKQESQAKGGRSKGRRGGLGWEARG